MKKTKIIISVIVCLVLLITLCACTRGSGDDITTEPVVKTYDTPIPIENTDINMTDLQYANNTYTLLKKYDVITINTFNDICKSETQIFDYDGETVIISHYNYFGEDDLYDGWIKGLNYEITGEKTIARISLDNVHSPQGFPAETHVSSYFAGDDNEKHLLIAEEGADYYKMLWSDDFIPEGEVHAYIFDKESLELREYKHTSGENEAFAIKVDFGRELNEQSKGAIEDYENGTKEITVISQIYIGDYIDERSSTLTVPDNWEIDIFGDEELALYSDPEQTEIYEYPGHGVDHTIYVTNSLG